jgi:hypothetical protein
MYRCKSACALAVLTVFAFDLSCSRDKNPAPTSRPSRQARAASSSNEHWTSLDDRHGVEKRMNALAERIRAETAATKPGHPVAGSFYLGDGLGTNLALDMGPGGEYVMMWHGCMGLYHHESGTYTFDEKSVKLTSAAGHADPGLADYRDLLRVAWGRRAYLVPRAETSDFVRAINGAREPRSCLQGEGFLRIGDEKLPAPGEPALPEEFKSQLAPTFKASILRVGEPEYQNWYHPPMVRRVVVLNAGSRHGVCKNMIFHPVGDAAEPFVARVTKVEEESCDTEFFGPPVNLVPGDELVSRVSKAP